MKIRVFFAIGVAVMVAGILTGCAGGNDSGPTGDPSLIALGIDLGPFNEAFDPETLKYTVSTDFLTLGATVTTAEPAEADATVTVNGGDKANAVSLVEGRNVISVRVITSGGASRVYTIEVTRGAEANFAQQAYAKASNTGADDHFGYSVALDGDTMAVGAPEEDSGATGVEGDATSNGAIGAGAVYVFVRNSGTWTQQAYIKASNTDAGDRFGWSVSLNGDTLAVGAPSEDSAAIGVGGNEADDSAAEAGAVYIYVRSGTVWTQQAYVKASNADAGDRFGWRVAMDGDTLAVGALGEDSGATGVDGNQSDESASNAGAAYVFLRSGVTWTQQAYVKASNTDTRDLFATSVALSGDTLAVGAPGESSNGVETNNNVPGAGAVYVFVRTGSIWAQEAYVKTADFGASDAFGASVALDGETLAVAAPFEDGPTTGIVPDGTNSNGATDAGAVYVFVRDSGIWSQQAYIKASNTNAGDLFGWRLALNAETLAVGAPAEDSAATGVDGIGDTSGVGQPDNNAGTAGAVYVFVRNGSTWTQLDYLKASNTSTVDGFGGSVAVSNDTVAVGAIGEDSNATGVGGDSGNNNATTSGAVYVFQ